MTRTTASAWSRPVPFRGRKWMLWGKCMKSSVCGVLHFLRKKNTQYASMSEHVVLRGGKPGTHTYPLSCRHLWTTFGSGWECGRLFKREEVSVNMGSLRMWRWKREGWSGSVCAVCVLCAARFRLGCTVSEMKEVIRYCTKRVLFQCGEVRVVGVSAGVCLCVHCQLNRDYDALSLQFSKGSQYQFKRDNSLQTYDANTTEHG